MRYVVIVGLLLLSACSGDPLWSSCDGDPGSCGDGYVCVPLTLEPDRHYCARPCSEHEECADLATDATVGGCARITPPMCRVSGCEADADCPDGLRCLNLDRPGVEGGSVCEP